VAERRIDRDARAWALRTSDRRARSLAAIFMLSELINNGIVPVVSQEIQRLIFQRRY
jgi:hypothetical protein